MVNDNNPMHPKATPDLFWLEYGRLAKEHEKQNDWVNAANYWHIAILHCPFHKNPDELGGKILIAMKESLAKCDQNTINQKIPF